MNKTNAEKLIRIDFEKWYSNSGEYPKSIDRAGESYKMIQAANAWDVWKQSAARYMGQDGEVKPDPIREAAIAYVRTRRAYPDDVLTVRLAGQKLFDAVDAVDSQGKEGGT